MSAGSLTQALYGDSEGKGALPLTLAQQFQLALDTISGLCYLHGGSLQVLHRDLKTDNILLDESLRAKLSDFGLSQLKQHSSRGSKLGAGGTPAYMAPGESGCATLITH